VPSHFGVIGDIHGNFAALDRILSRHPEIPFWLCVGDLASQSGAYPAPPARLYWIKGNNEGFDRIAAFQAGADVIPNLHYIPNGAVVTVGPLTVAGLGGTFAPTWYDTPAASLPHTPKDDKRRHFVREEVEALKTLGPVDVLLTHEAPKPFWIDFHPTAQTTRGGGPGLPSSTTPSRRWRRDVGKAAIAEVADALQPRLHCFGHHHVFATFTRSDIPTVCVDRVNRSYLLVDVNTFAWESRSTETGARL
jgi:Icc-related predicted phosphoesterase